MRSGPIGGLEVMHLHDAYSHKSIVLIIYAYDNHLLLIAVVIWMNDMLSLSLFIYLSVSDLMVCVMNSLHGSYLGQKRMYIHI